mgnify:CR=1 FL=1
MLVNQVRHHLGRFNSVLWPLNDPVVQHHGFLSHHLDICLFQRHFVLMSLGRVELPSVNLTSFKPILGPIVFGHLLLNLTSNIGIIVEHVDINALTFKEIHLKHCQIII